jgi:glutathione S-transferase
MPVLVLDNGETLIESAAILDYLDELVGADRALLPTSGTARRRCHLQLEAAVTECERFRQDWPDCCRLMAAISEVRARVVVSWYDCGGL